MNRNSPEGIKRRAEHIAHLIKSAKNAGIEVYLQVPILMN